MKAILQEEQRFSVEALRRLSWMVVVRMNRLSILL